MEQFARELIELKPDLLVTAPTPAGQALARQRARFRLYLSTFLIRCRLVSLQLQATGRNLTGVIGFQHRGVRARATGANARVRI